MADDPKTKVIDFGKFKGQSVRQMLGSKEGIDYARWYVKQGVNRQWGEVFKAALKASQL